MTTSPDALICIAAIAGAFGVKGEIKLKSFTQDPENCLNYGPLLDQDGHIVLTPTSARPVKNGVAITAPEVKTREQAESMKSIQLFVSRASLPEPEDEDDFYYSDLIGLDVKSTDGKRMGQVIAVHEFGAGDMLEIKPGKGAEKSASFFHPFTKLAVPKVDIANRRIIIDVIEAE